MHPALAHFDATYSARLNHRAEGFRVILQALIDAGRSPVTIVETGCLRDIGNWCGDGQSTLVLEIFVESLGGFLWSVDLDASAVAAARSVAGPRAQIVHGDSVAFLSAFNQPIDALYLDSLDVERGDSEDSAIHHMNELMAAWPNLRPGSVVAVDDTFMCGGRLVGKGVLVDRHMTAQGCKRISEGYIRAWRV